MLHAGSSYRSRWSIDYMHALELEHMCHGVCVRKCKSIQNEYRSELIGTGASWSRLTNSHRHRRLTIFNFFSSLIFTASNFIFTFSPSLSLSILLFLCLVGFFSVCQFEENEHENAERNAHSNACDGNNEDDECGKIVLFGCGATQSADRRQYILNSNHSQCDTFTADAMITFQLCNRRNGKKKNMFTHVRHNFKTSHSIRFHSIVLPVCRRQFTPFQRNQ